ncbi:hypothetical protein NC653_017155 [Populus alba x Populus x berolinensis]|uniref:RNase H type-1 domain-containing protein n=2 Tax=Populus alba x Populus x berolinensis TaxID=444605 RepID=A0AAD6QPK9_9ROSI|nr:hypothetical protein NC653_017155 [Populus alba x Populus x berolinensis]
MFSRVLKVHVKTVKGIFSCSRGSKDSNEAELLAVVKALELSSSNMDFIRINVLIEYDSSFVVNQLNNLNSRPCKF